MAQGFLVPVQLAEERTDLHVDLTFVLEPAKLFGWVPFGELLNGDARYLGQASVKAQ